MKHNRFPLLSLAGFFGTLLFCARTALGADPAAEIAQFSAFESLDMNKLAEGKIMSSKGAPAPFPRDLTVQSCYILAAPIEKAIAAARDWNPVRHPELKVYLHGDLGSKPTPDQFAKIASAPGNSAVASLVAATQKLNPDQPQLQMSKAEAKLYSKAGAGPKSGAMPGDVIAFWTTLLSRRAADFAAGGISKEPPYDFEGGAARASDEINRLLREQRKIQAQFADLIDSGNFSGSGSGRAHYWELFDVEGQAAFSVGISSGKGGASGYQGADLQYYASAGYFAMVTLYQMWPITVGGKPVTLVWRGDLLSSPELASLHGMEKLASGGVMSKEIQKAIAASQRDVVH